MGVTRHGLVCKHAYRASIKACLVSFFSLSMGQAHEESFWHCWVIWWTFVFWFGKQTHGQAGVLASWRDLEVKHSIMIPR